MSVLSSQSIMRRQPIKDPQPRTEQTFNGKRYSYGCGPASYDLRLDAVSGRAEWMEQFHIYPGEFVLASAVEFFQMPDDLIGIVHDKSSWARRGLSIFNTLIDPGWSGYLTLELTNTGDGLLTLPKGAGIAQVVFHTLDAPTYHPYDGKYQDQERGPQEAR
jgi:dCTP deaminase